MTDEQQYKDLFSSALSLYQILYSTEGKPDDNMGDYRSRVNKDILTKFLAVEERKSLHGLISGKSDAAPGSEASKGVRDALGSIIFSQYYQNVLLDFHYNTTERLLDGQTRCALHLNTMAVNPHAKDRFLDVGGSEYEDPWKEHLYHSFYYDQEDAPETEDLDFKSPDDELQFVCRALLNKEPEIDNSRETTPVEVIDKFCIAMYTVFGLASQTIHNMADKLKSDNSPAFYDLRKERKQMVRKISQNFLDRTQVQAPIIEEIGKLDKEIQKLQDKVDLYTARGTINRSKAPAKILEYQRVKKPLTDKLKRSSAAYQGHVTRYQKKIGDIAEKIGDVEIRYLALRKNARFVDQRIGENIYFKRFLVGLSLFNLVQAGNNLVQNREPRDVAVLWASTIEFTAVMLSQFSNADYRLGKLMLKKSFGKQAAAKMLGSTGLHLSVQIGWAAAGIGVVISVKDAFVSFGEGDTNAGVAYAVSAVAGAVSVGAGIAAFISTSSSAAGFTALAGPIAIGAMIVSLAAVFIAIKLTDDDLQTFLRATVFSEKNRLPGHVITSHQAKEYLCLNNLSLSRIYKRQLYNETRQEIPMGDFSMMLEWIHNLITNFSLEIPSTIDTKITVVELSAYTMRGRLQTATHKMDYSYSFEILCRFGHAKPSRSRFDYFMLIFPFAKGEEALFYNIEDTEDMHIREDEEVRQFARPILQTPQGLFEARFHFHWLSEVEHLAKRKALSPNAIFVFACRITVDEHNGEYWPFDRGSEPRYAAYYGPVMYQSKQLESRPFKLTDDTNRAIKNFFGTRDEIVQFAMECNKL